MNCGNVPEASYSDHNANNSRNPINLGQDSPLFSSIQFVEFGLII